MIRRKRGGVGGKKRNEVRYKDKSVGYEHTDRKRIQKVNKKGEIRQQGISRNAIYDRHVDFDMRLLVAKIYSATDHYALSRTRHFWEYK